MGLPKTRGVVPPKGGWEESSYYVVEISWNAHNPVHTSIFFTGFLNNGNPSGYNAVFNPTYDENVDIEKDPPYYLKAISKIDVG